MIAEWGAGEDSFAKEPAQCDSVRFSEERLSEGCSRGAKYPKLEGDKLTFTVQTLEGDLAGADGAAAIFIDIIGVDR